MWAGFSLLLTDVCWTQTGNRTARYLPLQTPGCISHSRNTPGASSCPERWPFSKQQEEWGGNWFHTGWLEQHRPRQRHIQEAHVQYGLVALRTVRREEREVVRLAVRSPVLLEEVATAQLRLTLGAHKVLRVPHLPQSRHHLHQEVVQINLG